ncbi:MAG TPA: hypothetical protein VNA20_18835 [Frankiaceae bacterium]|nr:hypothetical protein [Frankiaceae bacterium]
MSRRLLPRDRLGTRGPMLGLSLFCVLASVVFFALGRGVGAMTALLAAFILVAAAKRR